MNDDNTNRVKHAPVKGATGDAPARQRAAIALRMLTHRVEKGYLVGVLFEWDAEDEFRVRLRHA